MGLLDSLPILAAGFAGNPQTVMDSISMARAGREDRDERKLAEIGRTLFGGGRMPTEQDISAAIAAGAPPEKLMMMVGNFMKYKAANKPKPQDEIAAMERDAIMAASPEQQAQKFGLAPKPQDQIAAIKAEALLGATPEEQKRSFGMLRRDQAAPSYTPQLFINPATGEQRWVTPGVDPPAGFVKERSGFELETNPDGTTRFRSGVGATSTRPGGMERSTKSALEKEIVSSSDSLMKLRALEPMIPRAKEFLTYGGKAKKWMLSKYAKISPDSVSDGGAQYIKDAREFKNGVEQFFNQYRKEITGAAAPMAELQMLKESMLNFDMDPIEFDSAYNQMIDTVSRSIRLRNKFLREGVAGGEVGDAISEAYTAGIDDDVDARGIELEAQGLNEDQVVEQLMAEGYIR